jgi:hypothetical protein
MAMATIRQALPKGVGWRKARRELLAHAQFSLGL